MHGRYSINWPLSEGPGACPISYHWPAVKVPTTMCACHASLFVHNSLSLTLIDFTGLKLLKLLHVRY